MSPEARREHVMEVSKLYARCRWEGDPGRHARCYVEGVFQHLPADVLEEGIRHGARSYRAKYEAVTTIDQRPTF